MVAAELGARWKDGEHRGADSGDRIHNGACFRACSHRRGAALLGIPLERIHAPSALLERVVSGLVGGRRTLEDARVEQDLRFSANNLVVLLDPLEAGNGPRIVDR
jgi:hypothetical protein